MPVLFQQQAQNAVLVAAQWNFDIPLQQGFLIGVQKGLAAGKQVGRCGKIVAPAQQGLNFCREYGQVEGAMKSSPPSCMAITAFI